MAAPNEEGAALDRQRPQKSADPHRPNEHTAMPPTEQRCAI